jgi:rod shape determining protein RodA
MAMVYLQPSLGNAIIIGVIWLSLVYIVGIRWWQLGLVGALMVGATPLLWNFVLRDYMKQRILAFLDPSGDPLGTVYNINQARIAIGSGGLFGKGWGQGTQSQLQFLRVRHTDFIFSVIGEELGFVGAVLVLALLLLIIFRLLRAAQVARTPTGRFMAWGVATVVFFQTAVNIAMNLGLAPVAGIPLPFISYGGSSLITLLIAEGLVQSVAMRYKKIEFF